MNTFLVDKNLTFTVIVVVRSTSQEKVLHGSGSRLGAYEILEDITDLLKGQNLGLQIFPLAPLAEDAIDGNQTTAVYGVTFGTRFRV